ncbi:MAG TPA: DUF2812 domain-containing protein [Clostridiaceae bacterium]|nr:DUF2812 domain-containing protein [Clostridiaceae bacterium]
MNKLKVFWNLDREEKWLTEMAAKGHILMKCSALGIFTFADGTPQILNYKIDYKQFAKKSDYENYLSLFEDAGWQHICGTKNGGSHYFLPKTAEAGNEIFSDTESAAARYKTLYQICAGNLTLWAVYGITLLSVNNFNLSNLGFLTPGLWDKSGSAFWISFFFELPFVFFRVGIWVVLLALGVLYGYWATKAKQEYDIQMRENGKSKTIE